MHQTVSMLGQSYFLVSAKDHTESIDSHSIKLWLSCMKEAGQEDLSKLLDYENVLMSIVRY